MSEVVGLTSAPALDFCPMTPPDRDDPHVFYREAQTRPLVYSKSIGAHLVTKYADIVSILANPEIFSSSNAIPKLYDGPPSLVAALRAAQIPEAPTIVDEDGHAHARSRAVFSLSFTGARIRALVPLMTETAHHLIDELGPEPGPADLVGNFSAPFVQTIINTLTGFPLTDAGKIQAWSTSFSVLWNPMAPLDDRLGAVNDVAEYTGYLQDVIEQRRADPREDLISDLVHGAGEIAPVDDAAIHTMVREGSRIAGYETTRGAITSTILMILQHKHIQDAVVADAGKALPSVVEESLRRDAPHRGLFRITTEPVEMDGCKLPQGAPLLLMFGAGNRDDQKFEFPELVDLDRPNVRDHLAFGRGLHYCPGAPLARVETRIALETLFTRMPELSLAPQFKPQYVASYLFRELEQLMVCW